MDDEAYARKLFAILTNEQPAGIDPADPYGQADDGIDRYDGFGRDFLVNSVEVAEGEHGVELLVVFALALPSDSNSVSLPQRNTIRLAFDSQWRELSGYQDPAAFAPVVAREVGIAVGRQSERGPSRRAATRDRGAGRPAGLGSQAAWQRLLTALREEGQVHEIDSGRIEVHGPEGSVLTVVVTPGQWEQVLADHVEDDVDLYFADLLGPRQDDELFLVFCNGDLTRSVREELPPVRGRAHERKITRAQPEHDVEQGGWRARPLQPPRRSDESES